MLNPNGRKVVEVGDLCGRRNGILFLLYNLMYYNCLALEKH